MTLPEPGPQPRPRPQPPQSFSSFTDAVLHVLFPGTLGARNGVPGHRPAPAAITSQTDRRPTDPPSTPVPSREPWRAFAVTRPAASPSLPAHSRCTDTPLYIPRNGTRGSSTLALRKIFTFYKCTFYDFNTLYSTSEHHQRRGLGLCFVFPKKIKNFGRLVKFCGKKKCPATRLLPLLEEYASGWALGKKKCKWC